MNADHTLNYPEGFSYIPNFLSPQEHDGCVEQIRALPFVHDSFRGQQLKRSYAQFRFAYASTGRKLVAAPPFPDWLQALALKAATHCPDGGHGGVPRLPQCER